MAETKIEWADFTFNHVRGCTKVSAGCEHCYADTMSKRNPGTLGVWGPNGTRVVAAESYWRLPVKWNRDAGRQLQAWQLHVELCRLTGIADPVSEWKARDDGNAPPQRPRVFCASLADVFEDWRGAMLDTNGDRLVVYEPNGGFLAVRPYAESPGPHCRWLTMDDVRRRLFRLIDATPNIDWLLLTKRPENIGRMMPARDLGERTEGIAEGDYGYHDPEWPYFRPNVWIGTSVENQATADERIPHLLRVPAAVRFLSMEPLLGPVDLDQWLHPCCERGEREGESPCPICIDHGRKYEPSGIHWIIAGGESGNDARPMHPDWVRSIRNQCQAAGVPFHFKQWGEWSPDRGESDPTGDGVFIPDGRFICPYELDSPKAPDVDIDRLQWMYRVGKKAAGRLLDGRTWDEVPEAKTDASKA